MFSICARPRLDWAAATRAKYSGAEVEVALARVTFSHSLKLPLDTAAALQAVEGAVRDCLAGEPLRPAPRESGPLLEEGDEYVIPLVYTNEVYASVLVGLLRHEVEARWLESCRALHHFRRAGDDLQVYSRAERIATIHFCLDDLALRWPRTVALTPAEAAALLDVSSFALDDELCTRQEARPGPQ